LSEGRDDQVNYQGRYTLRALGIEGRLQCPECTAPLRAGTAELACDVCSRTYPSVAGVPVLLNSADEERLGAAVRRHAETAFFPRGSRVGSRLKKLAPGATWNRNRIVPRLLRSAAAGVILDVGSGERRLSQNIVNVDVGLHTATDVLANAEHLPFWNDTFDLVVCQGLLEHVPHPGNVTNEIWRVLKPGACAFVEVPFLQPFHADPDDYFRFTSTGLAQVMSDFQIVESGVSSGVFSALAFMLREFPEQFLHGRHRAEKLVKIPFALVGAVVRFADIFVMSASRADRLAASVFVVARKPLSQPHDLRSESKQSSS
jgi:SAM-dependent methyltransferase